MPAKPYMELRIYGVANLSRAATQFGGEGMVMFRSELTRAAQRVKEGVQGRYLTVNKSGPDERGAEGVVTRVMPYGATVKQTLRATEDISKRRPNYGPRMMLKAFVPALKAERAYVVGQAKAALETAKALYWNGR